MAIQGLNKCVCMGISNEIKVAAIAIDEALMLEMKATILNQNDQSVIILCLLR